MDPTAMMNMMSAYDPMVFLEQQRPRYVFPRVIPNQKQLFDSDEVFRKLNRETEIRYTGFRDRQPNERRAHFMAGCREGFFETCFVATGTNIQLGFDPRYHLDFNKEHGKVHIRTSLIMNGVCVLFKGWMDLEALDGIGHLEFDERQAMQEETIRLEHISRHEQFLNEMAHRQLHMNEFGGRY